MRFVGVDLHTNTLTACFQDERGRQRLVYSGVKDLGPFLCKLRKDDVVAVESTGNSRYFVDIVKKYAKKVIVVDPNKFDIIKNSVKKTDEEDSKNLAFFLSKDMLPEARMKSKEQSHLSSLVATRDKLVKLRTTLQNKIFNILNGEGIKLKKSSLSSEKGLSRVLTEKVDDSVCFELTVIVEQVRSLNGGIKKIEQRMIDDGQKLDGHENLASIKGIGDKAATILLTCIGNVNDFADENKLAAYFGIVPKVSKSNKTVHYGHITKAGTKIGRTTLVQCTLVAIKYSPYLSRYYQQVKKRRGSGKAIIATSRKMLGIIYQTLKEKWLFSDFPNFKYSTT